MKNIFVVIFLTFLTPHASGQNNEYKAPDYKGIKRMINSDESEFYYPRLMERYINFDTTLTLQDFRLLYYGFLFNDRYSPYGRSDYTDSVNIILSKDELFYRLNKG